MGEARPNGHAHGDGSWHDDGRARVTSSPRIRGRSDVAACIDAVVGYDEPRTVGAAVTPLQEGTS